MCRCVVLSVNVPHRSPIRHTGVQINGMKMLLRTQGPFLPLDQLYIVLVELDQLYIVLVELDLLVRRRRWRRCLEAFIPRGRGRHDL
jgi:hypothetical protein